MHNPVTLRFAFLDDSAAVARLAALDSSRPRRQPVLVAWIDGEPAAAAAAAPAAAAFRR